MTPDGLYSLFITVVADSMNSIRLPVCLGDVSYEPATNPLCCVELFTAARHSEEENYTWQLETIDSDI